MAEDRTPELQREVQRLIGRCMLRLQQYERLMKAMLAHQEIAGPVKTLKAQRDARVEEVSGKTLGNLVKSLFEIYVVAEGDEHSMPKATTPDDVNFFSFSHRIKMEPQKLAETRAAMEELVAMRNELVHHFIERFDLWSNEGCAAAIRYLEGCCERIGQHCGQLAGWVQSAEEARASMASFMQTEAFKDMVFNGIAPDGSFDWPTTGIARVLRQAAAEQSEGGWTRLERARAWIEAGHPEQTPMKYGLRTWPQLLTESRLFDLEYRPREDGRKEAWYRERKPR